MSGGFDGLTGADTRIESNPYTVPAWPCAVNRVHVNTPDTVAVPLAVWCGLSTSAWELPGLLDRRAGGLESSALDVGPASLIFTNGREMEGA